VARPWEAPQPPGPAGRRSRPAPQAAAAARPRERRSRRPARLLSMWPVINATVNAGRLAAESSCAMVTTRITAVIPYLQCRSLSGTLRAVIASFS